MAEPKSPDPVLLIVAAFSRWTDAIGWARGILQSRFGTIIIESPPFDFVETHYYDDEMGPGLMKQFFAFERLIQPSDLVQIKLETNSVERLAALPNKWGDCENRVSRPINLDPGYLNAGKIVLATTKDQAHRLYLGNGIYGEVTLRFERGEYTPWPWTYPNYCRADYREFFRMVRAEYLRLLRQANPRESVT